MSDEEWTDRGEEGHADDPNRRPGDAAPGEPPPDQGEAGVPAFPRRALWTVFSPGRLGDVLAEHPVWAVALVVGAVLVVTQTMLIPPEIWEASFRAQMLEQGREMPEGFAFGGNFARLLTLTFGTLGFFVFALVFAGLTMVLFVFILGDEGRFKQYLAVTAHAWLIPGLVGLLLVPLRISEQNPQLTLNVATFFYFLPEGYFTKVLTMLDLSQLWAWVVIAHGAAAIDARRSIGSATGSLLAMAVLLAMVFALFVPTPG